LTILNNQRRLAKELHGTLSSPTLDIKIISIILVPSSEKEKNSLKMVLLKNMITTTK